MPICCVSSHLYLYDMSLSLQNFRTSSEIKPLYRRKEYVKAIRQIYASTCTMFVCVQILFERKKTFKKKISVMKRTDILEPNKIKSGYYNNWVVFAWLLSGISFVFVIFMTSFFHIIFVVAVLFERRNIFYTCAKLCSQRQLRGLVDGCDHFKEA